MDVRVTILHRMLLLMSEVPLRPILAIYWSPSLNNGEVPMGAVDWTC
jgi:hypothetical protein